MPAKSASQARLMAAAEHNASFPMAQKVRQSMTTSQMHDFAVTPRKALPAHVSSQHPHKNLGQFLHAKKSR